VCVPFFFSAFFQKNVYFFFVRGRGIGWLKEEEEEE